MPVTATITATYRLPRTNQRATTQIAQINALAAQGLGQLDGSLDFLNLSQASFNAGVVGDEIQIVIVYNTVQPVFDQNYPTLTDATSVAANLWQASIGGLTNNTRCYQVSLIPA